MRLQIYSELLVLAEGIEFTTDDRLSPPPLIRVPIKRLYPAILRTNKKVYSEASAVLYSDNHFRFPETFLKEPGYYHLQFAETFSKETGYGAYIAPFLHQIGPQASRIRHISFGFPEYDHEPRTKLDEGFVKNIGLIRSTCTSIRVIELMFKNYAAMYFKPPIKEEYGLIYSQFKRLPSLKEVIVNFEVWPGRQLRDDLLKLVRAYRWTVQVTTPENPNESMVDQYRRFLFQDDYSEDED